MKYTTVKFCAFFTTLNFLLLARNKLKKPKSKKSVDTVFYATMFIGAAMGFWLSHAIRIKTLDCSYKMFSKRNKSLENERNAFNENLPRIDKIEPDKNLVFVGIMTAQKYLDTRAKSVYETWGRALPGKMSFFSGSGSSSAYDIPLVSLPGVDDSYPPQKKSFMMLKFMADNYLDKFEWFVRADDDVYIKSDKLELLLRSLDSSKIYFIGQPGSGTPEEIGLLSMEYGENFCMGGPGMIMSRATLRLILPHIKDCLKNLYTTHEDVEIGRCVRNHANASCTWAYEVTASAFFVCIAY